MNIMRDFAAQCGISNDSEMPQVQRLGYLPMIDEAYQQMLYGFLPCIAKAVALYVLLAC